MKAEPDSRVVKGKDVKVHITSLPLTTHILMFILLIGYETCRKFSVEDFETVKTTAWEGVRNYEARNIMQGMKVGDKVRLITGGSVGDLYSHQYVGSISPGALLSL